MPTKGTPPHTVRVDNFGNPDLYKIGHMGKGFNVTALPSGSTVLLAA